MTDPPSQSGVQPGVPKSTIAPYRLDRRFWLLLLAIAEVLGLSLVVDTQALTRLGGPWASALGYSPDFLSAMIAVGAATALIFALRPTSEKPATAPLHRADGRLPYPTLLFHLVAFGLFALFTSRLFESRAMVGPYASAWLIGWLAVGAVSLVLLTLVAMPAARWIRLAVEHRGLLLFGAVAGSVAWALGSWTDSLWSLLSGWTFVGVENLLQLLGQEVESEPARRVIAAFDGAGNAFRVKIDQSCSGFQGVGLVWVFVGLFLWLRRGELRYPQALLLLPIGTVAIWLSNIVRIALLIVIGAWVSKDIALGGFHSQAGWIAFILVALGIVAVASSVSTFRRAGADGFEVRSTATPAHLVPLLALVAMTMLGAALATTEIDRLYPLRALAAALAVVFFWRRRAVWRGVLDRGAVVATLAGLAVFVFWWLSDPGESRSAPAALAELSSGAAVVWLVSRFLGSSLVVPIVEELAFRGYLTRRLIHADFESVAPGTFTAVSFVGSSLLFGLLHGRWVAGTVAGMAYALVYYRRGRIVDAIVAHAVTNVVIAVYVLTSGDWAMWL